MRSRLLRHTLAFSLAIGSLGPVMPSGPALSAGPNELLDRPRWLVGSNVAFDAAGTTMVSGASDGYLLLWDAQTWALRRSIRVGTANLLTVDITPDGTRAAVCSRNGRVYVVDVASGDVVFEARYPEGTPFDVAFVGADRLLVTGDGSFVYLYDLTTGERLHRFAAGREVLPGQASKNSSEALAVAPDGRSFLVAMHTGWVAAFDLSTYERRFALRNKPRARDGARDWLSVEFSPDGQRAALGGVGGEILFIDAATGTRIDSIAVDPDFLVHVPFSADGRYVGAATLPGRTPVYEAATGTLVQDFRQMADFERGQLLFETRFHPDGTFLTGGPGLPIRLWDVERGTLLRTITVGDAFDRE